MSLTVTVKKKEITASLTLGEPRLSSTGKSNVLFTTSGYTQMEDVPGHPGAKISITVIEPVKKAPPKPVDG